MTVKCKPHAAIVTGVWAVVTATLLMAFGSALRAEDGTFAQRRACKPDVFRLCGQFIPNRSEITSCLQRNKPRLNPDCRAVFEGKLK